MNRAGNTAVRAARAMTRVEERERGFEEVLAQLDRRAPGRWELYRKSSRSSEREIAGPLSRIAVREEDVLRALSALPDGAGPEAFLSKLRLVMTVEARS